MAPTFLVGRRSRALGDIALSVGALLGIVCLLVAGLALAFDVKPLIFRSGSMSPSIETGALAVARSTPATDIQVGDIVSVVGADGVRVTHRVTSLERADHRAQLTLKGDANDDPDPVPYNVTEADRVIFDVPHLGYAASGASGPAGAFLAGMLVIGALAVILRRRPDDKDSGGPGAAPSKRPGGARKSRSREKSGPSLRIMTMACSATILIAGPASAAWTDSGAATSGALTAVNVPAPTAPDCDTTGGILGAFSTAVVSWTSAGPGYSYRIEIIQNSNGTVVNSDTTTSTTYSLSTALLGNLASTNFTIRVRAFPPGSSTWLSSGSITALARSRTLGLGTACGNL